MVALIARPADPLFSLCEVAAAGHATKLAASHYTQAGAFGARLGALIYFMLAASLLITFLCLATISCSAFGLHLFCQLSPPFVFPALAHIRFSAMFLSFPRLCEHRVGRPARATRKICRSVAIQMGVRASA